MYEKENGAVTFFTIFLALPLTILLTILIPAFVVSKTVLNTDFIEEHLTGKTAAHLLTTAMNEEFEKAAKDDGVDFVSDYQVFDDDMSKKFLKLINDRITTGTYDKSAADELARDISESVEMLLKDNEALWNYADADTIRQMRDDITESLHSSLDTMDVDLTDELNKANDAVNITRNVIAVICLVLAFIIIIIHKKKYRGFRATGISLFISGLISTAAMAFILFIFLKAFSESMQKEDIPQYVFSSVEKILKNVGMPIMTYAAAFLVAGLLLIIITNIIEKNYRASTGYPGSLRTAGTGSTYKTNYSSSTGQTATFAPSAPASNPYENFFAMPQTPPQTDFDKDWDENYNSSNYDTTSSSDMDFNQTMDSLSYNFDESLNKIKSDFNTNSSSSLDNSYSGFDFTDTSAYTSTDISNLGSSYEGGKEDNSDNSYSL